MNARTRSARRQDHRRPGALSRSAPASRPRRTVPRRALRHAGSSRGPDGPPQGRAHDLPLARAPRARSLEGFARLPRRDRLGRPRGSARRSTSTISSSSPAHVSSSSRAIARCFALRSRRDNVSYATRCIRDWRNPNCPRSGERSSDWIARNSRRTSPSNDPRTAFSSRPVSVARVSGGKVLPRTEASCNSARSSGARPSKRAWINVWSVSGTSRSSMGPVGSNRFPSRRRSPRSRSILTVSTA